MQVSREPIRRFQQLQQLHSWGAAQRVGTYLGTAQREKGVIYTPPLMFFIMDSHLLFKVGLGREQSLLVAIVIDAQGPVMGQHDVYMSRELL